MCGIVGMRRFDGRAADETTLRAMAARLAHRGPDGHGFGTWGAVGFGHTRLAIIDPVGSPQPMASANGPGHLTFNGEVFNYVELREELLADGAVLRTKGDSEVLLEICRRRGPAGLAKVVGQFAFAFHDERTGELWLARDRMGILPLYWYADRERFLFASEMKALFAAGVAPALDEDAIDPYLTFRSVPSPGTLFRGIHKLRPGHVLRVGADGKVTEEAYWKLPAEPGGETLDGDDALAQTEAMLARSVGRALVSDVPVGAYLSGGLDSSLVVAFMKRARNGGPVSTAGFEDVRFDELPFARALATALGTDHEEVIVRAGDFEQLWQRLIWHRDSPLSEPAEVAVFRIAERARSKVKVLLSGDGSDELFGGYPKYGFETRRPGWAAMPAALRVPVFRAVERILPWSWPRARIASRALATRTEAERFATWFAPFTWYERKALHAGLGGPADPTIAARAKGDILRRMLYVDCHTWLSDNLLEGGDRMAMAAGVENRPPFVSHEMVELAFRIDSHMKLRGREGKWILRRLAQRYLPPGIVERRKIGFRVPLDAWLRDGLREFARDRLLPRDSFVADYFDRARVERLLDGHLSGRRDESLRLWTLLGLELWHRTFLRGSTDAPAAG
jgi:asparagine synthase (glutamine-hydrolysing)